MQNALMHDEAAVNDDVFVYLAARTVEHIRNSKLLDAGPEDERKPSRTGSPIFRRPQAGSLTVGSSRQQSCRAIASSRSVLPISTIKVPRQGADDVNNRSSSIYSALRWRRMIGITAAAFEAIAALPFGSAVFECRQGRVPDMA
jgi:hypothetical protein